MRTDVFDNTQLNRFELPITEDESAVCYYKKDGELLILISTEVPFAFTGHGYASALAEGVFRIIRERRQKVWATCEFMGGYIAKHPELGDLLGR